MWLQQLHVYTPCDLFWKYLPAISPHAPISLSATDAKRYYEASIEALLTVKALFGRQPRSTRIERPRAACQAGGEKISRDRENTPRYGRSMRSCIQYLLRSSSSRLPTFSIQFSGDEQLPPRSPMRQLILPPRSIPFVHLLWSPLSPFPNRPYPSQALPCPSSCANAPRPVSKKHSLAMPIINKEEVGLELLRRGMVACG